MSIADWSRSEREQRAADQNDWEDAYLAELAALDAATQRPRRRRDYAPEDDAYQGETTQRYEEGKMP